jgi:Flp pilus assembly pilin Flp
VRRVFFWLRAQFADKNFPACPGVALFIERLVCLRPSGLRRDGLQHIKIIGEDRGATAIEYSLIVAGIAIAISIAVFSTGGSLASVFESIQRAVAGVASQG